MSPPSVTKYSSPVSRGTAQQSSRLNVSKCSRYVLLDKAALWGSVRQLKEILCDNPVEVCILYNVNLFLINYITELYVVFMIYCTAHRTHVELI